MHPTPLSDSEPELYGQVFPGELRLTFSGQDLDAVGVCINGDWWWVVLLLLTVFLEC